MMKRQFALLSSLMIILGAFNGTEASSVTTVAGIQGDFSGVGDSIGGTASVAVDSNGNIYTAAGGLGHAVYKITPDGTKTLFAGTETSGFNNLAGTATSIELNNPGDVYVDGIGNVYIADSGNQLIRRVTPAGDLTTVAGVQGDSSGTGDSIGGANAVAVDSNGNIYVAGGGLTNEVYKITSGGTKTTFAGTGTGGYNGDTGTATTIQLSFPLDVYVDSSDNVYIADTNNRLIRRVTPAGDLTTVAGIQGDSSGTGDSLGTTNSVAVDSLGNLIVNGGSLGGHSVFRISGATKTTIVGTGTAGFNGDCLEGTSTQLNGPSEVYIGPNDTVYIADTLNRLIRLTGEENNAPSNIIVTPATSTVTEGNLLSLSGSFTDPDACDEDFTVTINWGEGTPTVLDLTGGTKTYGPVSFNYPDGDGTGTPRTITVTVNDGEESDSNTADITVLNAPPALDAGGPYSVNQGATVNLAGTASDVPGDPLTISWDLDGDSVFGETGANAERGDETSLTPTFDATGLAGGGYTVTLRVSDGDASVDDTATVTVNDITAPTAQIVEVAPDPRNTPVGDVTINFSEPVTGVDITDFTLTRDANPVDLSGLSIAGSGASYSIDLSTLSNVTGSYELTLVAAGSGITDGSNPLAGNASDAFVVDVTEPTTSLQVDKRLFTGTTITGTYTASDVGTGLDNVHLFALSTNTGGWIDAGPVTGGTWSFGPIPEDPVNSGLYVFTTIATDVIGNKSDFPETPDPQTIAIINTVENGPVTLPLTLGFFLANPLGGGGGEGPPSLGEEAFLIFPMKDKNGFILNVIVELAEVILIDNPEAPIPTITVSMTEGDVFPDGFASGTDFVDFLVSISQSGNFTFSSALVSVDYDEDQLGGVAPETIFYALRDEGSGPPYETYPVDVAVGEGLSFETPGFSDWYFGTGSLLSVKLQSFNATARTIGEGVDLAWETATETDNAGFNVYRADDSAGYWQAGDKLNGPLIPAMGDIIGARYSFYDDEPLSAGEVRGYYLEDMELDGDLTLHGPIFTDTPRSATRLEEWTLMD